MLRLERRWSARRLSEACEELGEPSLTRATIAKIESGLRKTLRPGEVAVLAQVFGVSPGDLLSSGRSGSPAGGGATNTGISTAPGGLPARNVLHCPAQLPSDSADFTGREEQVKHLSELLAPPGDGDSGALRIALVTGSGGVGKTSLAVHAAHRVGSHFPDGQLYVDLLGATADPLPPADVLARFLRDLGVDGVNIPVGEAERAARYRTSLAGRRILVVLDNARAAAQIRPLLPGAGSCAVLVTARSRMPDLDGAKLVDLNVLDDDEALILFAKVVGDERVAAEPEATAELLDVCAGLPLAIRICAARLATRSGWTIRSMANRLRDEHRRLDELTVGDLAVRASLEVSFASLPSPSHGVSPADAFRLLGLWHGPTISTVAAAALFGSDEDQAVDALELLVDVHLLESVAPDRYKFHDLLRVYASERAVADFPEERRNAATARLLEWYMRTADHAAQVVTPHTYTIPLDPAHPDPPALVFTSPENALAWYDSERANIPAATRQAAASCLHDIAWRLPAPLFRVFHARANWADCIATHQIALDSARKAANRQGEAWVLNNLGWALGRTGDGDGIGCVERALAIRREIGDRPGEAQTANNLGDLYQLAGRHEEGLEMLHRALDLNRQIGRRRGEGIALNNLGDALLSAGRAEEAVGWLQQALARFTELEDADGLGYALYNLGRCQFLLGHDKEAVDSFQRAVASHQATGHLQQQARTLSFLGRAQARLGDTAEARQSLARSAKIYDSLGDSAQAAQARSEATTPQNLAKPSREPAQPDPRIADRLSPAETSPRFRILGPLSVRVGGTWHAVEAPRWRSLLATLLLSEGMAVPVSTLINGIWGDAPPALATNLLSIYTLRLRRLIDDTDGRVLVTRSPGYQLNINTGDLDAHYFEELLAQGTSALNQREPGRAASLLTKALDLWHGNAFANVPRSPTITAEAERLEQLRRTTAELCRQATTAFQVP